MCLVTSAWHKWTTHRHRTNTYTTKKHNTENRDEQHRSHQNKGKQFPFLIRNLHCYSVKSAERFVGDRGKKIIYIKAKRPIVI